VAVVVKAGFFVVVLALEAQGLVDGGVVELEDAAPGLVAGLQEAAAVGGIGLLGSAERASTASLYPSELFSYCFPLYPSEVASIPAGSLFPIHFAQFYYS